MNQRMFAALLAILLLAGGIHGSAAHSAQDTSSTSNPLLTTQNFPLWDQIKAEHVVPAVRQVLTEESASLELMEKDLAAAGSNVTFERIFKPYTQIRLRLDFVNGQIDHLSSVVNSPVLREAVESITPERVAFELRFGQSKAIYDALSTLKSNAVTWASLSPDQQRLVNITFRDMVNSGVGLSEGDRQRFNEIVQELSQLATDFSNNVLDSSAAFKLVVTDRAQLDGLSETTLLVAAQNAQAAGHVNATREDGPWVLQLGDSTYASVIAFAHDRSLREKMYKAYTSVAAVEPWDNSPIIEMILTLRRELAQLLGFKNWAEYRFTGKMATLDAANARMQELVAASRPVAVKEQEQLTAFARNALNDTTFELKWWDTSYWSERQKEALYKVRTEVLREYLPLDSVLGGLFKLAEKMYGVSIKLAQPQPPVWHPDVRVFEVSNTGSLQPIAYFYADLFSRPGSKSSGAWENSFQSRSSFWKTPSPAASAALTMQNNATDTGIAGSGIYTPRLAKAQAEWVQMAPGQLPLVIVVSNQDPPADGKPSLMTMGDARTLFHEMGHAFMDLLAASKEGLMAGNRNVEIDAIEVPSQMQEKWVYDPTTFNSFAKHWKTGEAVPEAVFKQIAALQKYRTGYMFTRQLTFAVTDLRLHSEYVPGSSNTTATDIYLDSFAKINPIAPYPGDHFLNDFKHIFSGGYEAGYYSYMWADVMSADIFTAFLEQTGNGDAAVEELGQRFRDTFFSLGGSAPPAEVFRDFRGRDPDVTAMLKYNGLLAQS